MNRDSKGRVSASGSPKKKKPEKKIFIEVKD